MNEKKKEILDNLELSTPEVEERVVQESIELLIEGDEKFKKRAFSTPVKYLKADLLNIAIFLNVLIEKLDLDFFNENDMESYKDDHSAWNYKDVQIEYIGDERYKQDLLMVLLHFIESLDFTRIRLLENELTEDKDVIKKYEKREMEKQE